jgi:hypothetical protein
MGGSKETNLHRIYGDRDFWVELLDLTLSNGYMTPKFSPEGSYYTVFVNSSKVEALTMHMVVNLKKYDSQFPPGIKVNDKELTYTLAKGNPEYTVLLNKTRSAFDKTYTVALFDKKPPSGVFGIGGGGAWHGYNMRIVQPPEFEKILPLQSFNVTDSKGDVLKSKTKFDPTIIDYLYTVDDDLDKVNIEFACQPEATNMAFDDVVIPNDGKGTTQVLELTRAVTVALLQCQYKDDLWTLQSLAQRTYVLTFRKAIAVNKTDVQLDVIESSGHCEKASNADKGYTCRSLGKQIELVADFDHGSAIVQLVNDATGIKVDMPDHIPSLVTVADCKSKVRQIGGLTLCKENEWTLSVTAGPYKASYPVRLVRPQHCLDHFSCPGGFTMKSNFNENSMNHMCMGDTCAREDLQNCCEYGNSFKVVLNGKVSSGLDIREVLSRTKSPDVVEMSKDEASEINHKLPYGLLRHATPYEAHKLASLLSDMGLQVSKEPELDKNGSVEVVSLVFRTPPKDEKKVVAALMDCAETKNKTKNEDKECSIIGGFFTKDELKDAVHLASEDLATPVVAFMAPKTCHKVQSKLAASKIKTSCKSTELRMTMRITKCGADADAIKKIVNNFCEKRSSNQGEHKDMQELDACTKVIGALESNSYPAEFRLLKYPAARALQTKLQAASKGALVYLIGANKAPAGKSRATCIGFKHATKHSPFKCPTGQVAVENAGRVKCKNPHQCVQADDQRCCTLPTTCSAFAETEQTGLSCPSGAGVLANSHKVNCSGNCGAKDANTCCQAATCDIFKNSMDSEFHCDVGWGLKKAPSSITCQGEQCSKGDHTCCAQIIDCTDAVCPFQTAHIILGYGQPTPKCISGLQGNCTETCCFKTDSCEGYKCPAGLQHRGGLSLVNCGRKVCNVEQCCKPPNSCKSENYTFDCPVGYTLKKGAEDIRKLHWLTPDDCCNEASSCENYECPKDHVLKSNPDEVFCSGVQCGEDDADTCCSELGHCSNFKCPYGMILRSNPEKISCKSGNCMNGTDDETCCEAAARCDTMTCKNGKLRSNAKDIACGGHECEFVDTAICCEEHITCADFACPCDLELGPTTPQCPKFFGQKPHSFDLLCKGDTCNVEDIATCCEQKRSCNEQTCPEGFSLVSGAEQYLFNTWDKDKCCNENGFCSSYECPIGFRLVEDAATLHCQKHECTDVDAGVCCEVFNLEGKGQKKPTESTPTGEFGDVDGLVLEIQPQDSKCGKCKNEESKWEMNFWCDVTCDTVDLVIKLDASDGKVRNKMLANVEVPALGLAAKSISYRLSDPKIETTSVRIWVARKADHKAPKPNEREKGKTKDAAPEIETHVVETDRRLEGTKVVSFVV